MKLVVLNHFQSIFSRAPPVLSTMAEYLTQFLEWESKFNVDSILEFHNAQYDTAHPTPTTLVALVYTRLRFDDAVHATWRCCPIEHAPSDSLRSLSPSLARQQRGAADLCRERLPDPHLLCPR